MQPITSHRCVSGAIVRQARHPLDIEVLLLIQHQIPGMLSLTERVPEWTAGRLA